MTLCKERMCVVYDQNISKNSLCRSGIHSQAQASRGPIRAGKMGLT